MKIKYIPVSLRTLNEGSRGKQQQYYVLKRSDNFDFSSVGDKLYNEIKSLGKRGSNKDFIKTYLNNGIKTFPLAKRFNTIVIELPQIPKAKVSDIIYDAKNDRFLYLIQRYDGGGIEKGNKQNIYLSADSINFPVEARNVKKKYNINYFSNDTVIESESINNNIKNTYCNKPIELLSCIYDDDIDQYIILIKDLTNDNEINLYLNKEDFDIISKYGCVSDEGGHELCLDISKLNLNESNKVLNESFKDPFIKELIDNSFKSSYGSSYSIPIKRKLRSLSVSFDWANISNNDYIEVSPNEAKNNYPTDFKFYCKYDNEHKPYIIGIVNPHKYTLYDIYSIKNSKGSVVKNHSELYISRDADFALVFDSKLSDDYRNKRKTRIESRENALALMDPEEIKSNNINRYLSIITNKKYNNDILDDYVKNTLSIGNKKIEDLFDQYLKLNKSDDSDKNFIFRLYNNIKELNGYISGLLSTYEKYIDTKNLIKSMKGSSYDVEQIKQYKDNIIRYIDNIKDI